MTTKRRFIRHLPLMLVGLAMGLGVFININTSKNVEPVQAAIDYSACETAHNANNKSNLKTALYNVVKNGNPGSYSDLWTSYLTVYKKSNGYLKDYYSNTSTFTSANQDNGSGGTTEGDKYNREHTIPKSWWGGSTSNQGADIFIVVPADKLVNNKRSDNCLGMVGSATFSSNNNYSKLGTSTSSWNFFGSPVFEPNDEVKGDLARIVFYSVIKYDVSSWTTGNGSYVFSGNTFASSNFGLTANAIKLFSYWNNLDKPDDWERTVNTRGNNVQGNPNPFIDHPEYANTLWGDVSGYTTYSTSGASLSVSPSSGSITVGNTLNLTATASGGSGNVTWSITSGSSYVSLNNTTGNSVTVTGVAAGTATVTASYSGRTASCSITINASGGGESQTTYTRLTSISNIDNSASYVLGIEGTGFHYSGTSSWGLVALPSDQTPLYYTLTKESGNSTFTAKTTINNILYYLTVPTSNTFTMSTSSTSIKLGTTTEPASGENASYAVTNSSTTTRHLRINSSSGLRSYAGTTGSMAYFYKVEDSSSSSATLSSISISGYTSTFVEGDSFNFGGTVTARYSDNTTANVTSQATFSGYNMTTTGNQTVTVSYGGKSTTYQITVNKGTLSSIAVSGYTTNYLKGAAFSFDGTCTATFANNYQKTVTPTSVSSPDMSTSGQKTITVSYSYNGITKETTYTISVAASRTVIETSSSSAAVTWPSSSTANVSADFNLAVSNVEYTYYESGDKALRLGTGSGGGKISITTTATIVSLTVNAKAYGSSYKGTLTVGDKTVSVNNDSSYSDFSVTLTTPSSSIYISTASKNVRINLKSIDINCNVSTDISSTSDCTGLENFIETYMHMDYTQNLGYCKDNSHHYYSTAKSAFNNLNTHQRSLFVGNSAYASEFDRLSSWASANGESFNSNNQLSQRSSLINSPVIFEKNSSIIALVLLTFVGIGAIGAFIYTNKKKSSK